MLLNTAGTLPGLTFIAAGIVAGFFTYACLRDGSVTDRNPVERATSPFRYWLRIALYTVLTIGLLITGGSLVFSSG
jgi:hypothetical protein